MRHARPCVLLTSVLLSGMGCASEEGARLSSTHGAHELVMSVPAGTEAHIPRRGLRDPTSVWVEMIRSANRSIDFAYFYITSIPDHALDRVLDAIENAGRRGVAIRFLVDKTMTRVTSRDDRNGKSRLRATPNVALQLVDYTAVSGGVHHAKYFVVDGTTAYLGSQNFDWRALEQIHELGVRTSSPEVIARLVDIFDHDWHAALASARSQRDGAAQACPAPADAVRIVASPPAENPTSVCGAEEELLRLIGGAQHELLIELMTYSVRGGKRRGTWRVIDDALRAAAARGVTVRLLVDVTRAARHLDDLRALADAGVAIRLIDIPPSARGRDPTTRLIHAKLVVVDQRTLWIGSSNWQRDYFRAMRNVELVLPDPALATTVRATHTDLWNSPYATDVRTVRSGDP